MMTNNNFKDLNQLLQRINEDIFNGEIKKGDIIALEIVDGKILTYYFNQNKMLQLIKENAEIAEPYIKALPNLKEMYISDALNLIAFELRAGLDDVLTIKEASEITGRPVPSIKKMILDNRIVARKSGGTWLISKLSLDKYFQNKLNNIK